MTLRIDPTWPPREHALPVGVQLAEALATQSTVTLSSWVFPRADANQDGLYRERYCGESKAQMQHYVAMCFTTRGAWPTTIHSACCYIENRASSEIGRPTNVNEDTLIVRVVRDVLEARAAMERARVLAREII